MLFEPLAHTRLLFPFQAVHQQLERLVAEPGRARSTPLAFALFARENALLLRAALPGIDAKDIAIEIDGDALTVSGRWPDEPEDETARAKHAERPRGKFARSLRVPFEVDAARVQARIERGVLEIEIPRLEKSPPVRVPVLVEKQDDR